MEPSELHQPTEPAIGLRQHRASAAEFRQLILENLDQLARLIGAPLAPENTRVHGEPPRTPDPQDPTGRLTMVELQFGISSTTHLGRAAACSMHGNTDRVIWIAEAFRPQHLLRLKLLNEHLPRQITAIKANLHPARTPTPTLSLSIPT